MSNDYASMRRQYEQDGVGEGQMADDPITQFNAWFKVAEEARPGDWFETNAMTLSTATPDGRVSSRVVLLKGVSDAGFVFYTNYESQKGREIESNPAAALGFFWPHLDRQVRVAGTVTRTSREMSLEYFRSRPIGSQLGALASEQSRVVANRQELERQFAALEKQYAGGDVPLPDHWGGYCLSPTEVEFWQGRTNRLHDRLRYRREGPTWVLERLSP